MTASDSSISSAKPDIYSVAGGTTNAVVTADVVYATVIESVGTNVDNGRQGSILHTDFNSPKTSGDHASNSHSNNGGINKVSSVHNTSINVHAAGDGRVDA